MKVSKDSSAAGSDTGTPQMKKLKQARLPFQIITPETTTKTQEITKKRKLSEEEVVESPNKVIKKTKDVEVEEPLIISDEEIEKVAENSEEVSPKPINPYVSLVDTALKRKLKKKKSPNTKKRGNDKNKKVKFADEKIVENVLDDKEIEKTKGNKENIQQIILIEDSNGCDNADEKETAQSESKDNEECTQEAEAKENEEKITKNSIPKMDQKVISSMKDEGIVELSDDELSDNEEQNQLELSNCSKSGENVDKISFKNKNNSSKTAMEVVKEDESNENSLEEKLESTEDGSDDEQDKEETSAMNTSLETSECEDDERDVSMNEISDDSKNVESSENKNENLTPKSSKLTVSSESKSGTDSSKTPVEGKKLTPRQLQKKLESAKKQQEREKEKQERLRKKREEKEERDRQRLEKEEQKKKEREEKEEQKKKEREEKEKQKEQEKREREEKEEAKKKEREEKELQKKREREAKEEEKRKRDLEKEEDKRKKELEKEEAEIKKKKASAAFVNFFVPKASGSKQPDVCEQIIKHDYLSNFTRKADMRLAPLNRKILNDNQKMALDGHLNEQETEKNGLFVCQIKSKDYEVGRSERTWPVEEEDVMVVEDELPIDSVDFIPEENHKLKMRCKLLSFSENRRPPYWGTWRRRSKNITGRKPFGMDTKILDYECDSDDEWEEEEPGESVGGSVAGSDDEEEDNDYDVDNDFMVPHGYLSEEEAMGDEDEVLSPESQKAKLKIMQSEFEKEMKKNIDKLHPRSIGIIWQNSDGGKPDSCKDSLWDFLLNKKILTEDDQVIIRAKPLIVDCALEEAKNEKTPKKPRKITDEMTPDLIKLVHGNTNNRGFLAYEFQTYLAKMHKEQNEESVESYVNVSKMSIARKIKEISKWMSCPIEGPMFGKMCWCVSKEILDNYESKVDLPNKWSYVLKPKSKTNSSQITQFLNTDQANS